MSKTFRHNAGFGKRMEFFVISKMLEQGLDVYIPLVDDFGIDAIVRKGDGSFVELQIKALQNMWHLVTLLFLQRSHMSQEVITILFFTHNV
ncbi:MAG TPA: hypothetical protein VKC90_10090 [Chitinophagaceae bacterium]|nr:hypothetical protein [Chitinophagaceae bacterium]